MMVFSADFVYVRYVDDGFTKRLKRHLVSAVPTTDTGIIFIDLLLFILVDACQLFVTSYYSWA